MQLLHLIVGTVWLRPYVFAFLGVYLLLATPAWGWRRTAVYTSSGYFLAWLAEYSSTHNGFPFGYYVYHPESTIQNEIWVAGVPFMDSLSFVFLTFGGMQTARLIVECVQQNSNQAWDLRWENNSNPLKPKTIFLAGLLTMGLDIVIDPLSLRGDRWFLGQIYHYPGGGIYFGVPISNFSGWAFLSWAIIGTFAVLDRKFLAPVMGPWRSYPGDALWGSGLFLSILLFNLTVTFAIGEVLLGILGICWTFILTAPALIKVIHAKSSRSI